MAHDMTQSPTFLPASRRDILLAAGAFAAAAVPVAARAQEPWPARTITIVVPFTPGTSMDVLARTLGPKLSLKLGQPVIVDNRVGASGNIGTGYVAHAAPDGYTLLMTVSTFVMNPSLFKSVPYDPVTSFTPIGRTAVGALVFAVNPDFPAKTLAEAIKLFKASPGKYSYASPGNGTPQHLAMELFKLNAGVDILHVPYKGSAGAITDLLGGQVHAMILPVNTAMAYKQTGKLRVLAATQEKRIPVMPDVPTLAEQGVHNADVDLWFGLLAPLRTPPAIVARINGEMNRILAEPDVREVLDKQGLVVTPGTPDALAKLVASDSVRWAGVVKKAGITAD
jgi:tripartite-type tricarboxylate transporter receptor subunit TctC